MRNLIKFILLAVVVGLDEAHAADGTQLTMTRETNGVVLAWSTNSSTQFYLQYATNCCDRESWLNGPDPTTNEVDYTVADETANPARFYRLKSWEVLFSGGKPALRVPGQSDFPSNSWSVAGDELRNIVGAPAIHLITFDAYTNFELRLEWSAGSSTANSGVYYFWDGVNACPEMQLVNDPGYPAYTTNQYCGALYGIIAPTNEALQGINQFNKVKVTVKEGVVEHWLNDRMVVSYPQNSTNVLSHFGSNSLFSGRIGFQFHNGESRYRNILLRRLP